MNPSIQTVDSTLPMASAFFPLISFLLLLPLSSDAQTVGNITVGASLSADENSASWISRSGDFAFGFQPLTYNKNLFLLAIWYDKIPDKTVVWYANGDGPAPRGSKLQLTADSGLVLSSPQGEQLWSTEVRGAVDRGTMDDNGNFMLLGSSSIIWESFKHPVDTVLPSQTLDVGVALSSRKSETNFSRGRFQLVLTSDGDLVLTTVNLPSIQVNDPYYSFDTTGASSSPGSQLVFNDSGYLFVLRENEERQLLTPRLGGSARDLYYRTTLEFDGIFILYSHPKASTRNARWTPIWSKPDNICIGMAANANSGACGFNSICNLTAEGRPSCGCPQRYTLVDPNDPYGSCKPNFTLSCEQEPAPVEDLYEFEELINVDWPQDDYAFLAPFTEEKCRESCLHDCMCAAAIFRDGDKCWKKKLPLSNGKSDPSLNWGKALLKVRKGDRPPYSPYFPDQETKNKRKNQGTLILALSVFLGTSVLFNFILATAICLGFYFIYRKKLKPLPKSEPVVETNLRSFTYEELVDATNEFKEELGRGAFGIVYRGTSLMSYLSQIAVKKLNTFVHDHAEKEFKTELKVIGQTHHKNLVRLLGFCDDGNNRLLVYEYLSNGSLASLLFEGSKPSWSRRTEIAVGVARGLLYLHEECSTQIIHCDIKPQNILLDEHYNARISDFGLAKLLLLNQSHTNTAIRGTKGYVAPEWFRNLPITVKVDVYSFGVVLLELTCCRRGVEMGSGNEERAILTDWAYDCYREGTLDELVEYDIDALNDTEKVERYVKVAIWCIQEDPSLRPSMRVVTQMLEGVVEVPVPPCPCPYVLTVTG